MRTNALPVVVTLLIAAHSSHAQIVNDGTTNTLSNVTNTFTGDVTVGTNGSFTLLVLSDNVLLTNSVNGLIGRNNGAYSNEVRLVSPTARWFMGGSIFVGNNGGANRLVVSNGATVRAGSSGTIGYGADFTGNANSNSVTVSGAGSLWSNGLELVIGELGFANRLEVNGGAWVVSGSAIVGRSLFGPSNTVVVSGAGSVWSNRADLQLGASGPGNQLVISGGGWVVTSNTIVGSLSFGNQAWVTGMNSTWSNRGNFWLGYNGTANQLLVDNGGTVVAGTDGIIGDSNSAKSNVVFVSGPGSLFAVATNLNIGSNGSFNRLVISNGAQVLSGRFGTVGGSALSTNNEVVVTGAGSLWSNRNDLTVGNAGVGNRLVVSDGGRVESDTARSRLCGRDRCVQQLVLLAIHRHWQLWRHQPTGPQRVS